MAKDGTNRGGRRIRAGHKPDDLIDKIQKGNEARVLNFPSMELEGTDDYGTIADLQGEDIPEPDSYLSAQQRDGEPLGGKASAASDFASDGDVDDFLS